MCEIPFPAQELYGVQCDHHNVVYLTFRQCSEQCRIFPRRFIPLGIPLDDSLALLGRQAGTLVVRRLYTT